MNENENEVIIDSTETNDTAVTEETQETAKEEVKETPQETPEAKVSRLKRQLEQAEKKAGIKSETKSEPKVEPKPKSSELGYAEMAYLQGNDIKGTEEFALVAKYQKDTGKSLIELVDENSVVGKLIRSEIKEMREAKTTSDAVPKSTKRSSPSPRDSVDYWLKKPFNEVPDEMRIQVVNRRLELEKSKNPFTQSPIA